MSHEQRVADRGIQIPTPHPPVALFVPAVRAGDLLFLSGAGPVRPDGSLVRGKVGTDVDLDGAREAARLTGLERKAPLYALAGVPECWVVDLAGGRVVVHREPGPDGYGQVRSVAPGETVAAAAVPVPPLDVAELLAAAKA